MINVVQHVCSVRRVHAVSEDSDLLTVSSRHYFLNEHHWSFCTVSSALDDEPQACSLGDAYQLNDTVTGERNRESQDDTKHD